MNYNKPAHLILFLALLLAPLFLAAQELAPESYRAELAGERYEISYSIPADGTDAFAQFDIFFLARASEASEWFKLTALTGDYQNVHDLHPRTAFWNPLQDKRAPGPYEFKLYAIKRSFLPSDYSYAAVEQFGQLKLSCALEDSEFRIHNGMVSSERVIVLPVGRRYEVLLIRNHILLAAQTVDVEAGKTTEIDMTPTNGYLILQTNLPGVKFEIDGSEYAEVDELPLPPGTYQVRAFGANPVTGTFEETRLLEIKLAETTFQRFDFPHGTLTLSSNEPYARFSLDGVKLDQADKLWLPVGTYAATAVLPRAITGFGDYQLTSPVTIEDGVHLDLPLDFTYGSLTFSSSLPDTKYLIDGVAKQKVNKLKLPVGEHIYTAMPPAPYVARTGNFVIRAGENLSLELEFAQTTDINYAERRREFTWRFGLMPAAVLEANHYFNLAGSETAGYSPLCSGLSVSGFRFKAINLWNKEFTQPYSAKYPALMAGAGLLDQAVLTWEQDSGDLGILLDLASLSVGAAHLSPGGLLHAQLELIGYFSYQKPLQLEDADGRYSYVTSFKDGKERSYAVWDYQWGSEARCQFGVRLAKYNYLNLHLGTRYQQPLGGAWYSNGDIRDWMLDEGPVPTPSPLANFPIRNAAFEGLSFYAGIGFETSLIPSLLGLILDAADRKKDENLQR